MNLKTAKTPLITFKYLHRDGDPEMSHWDRVNREVSECQRHVWSALKTYPNLGGAKLALWMMAYHAGMAFHPMASRRLSTIDLTVAGKYLRVTFRRNQSDLYILRENLIDEIYRFDGIDPRSVQTVVDMGANIGLASLFLQARYPAARLVCVEPVRANTELIRVNAAQNGFDWIVERAAIAGTSGTVTLHPNEWWSSSTTTAGVAEYREGNPGRLEKVLAMPPEEVEAVTVEQLMDRHGLDQVDILKLDVEGAEADVFAQDTSWLERVRVLIVEIHDKYVDRAAIESVLQRAGFEKQVGRHGPTDAFVNSRLQDRRAKA